MNRMQLDVYRLVSTSHRVVIISPAMAMIVFVDLHAVRMDVMECDAVRTAAWARDRIVFGKQSEYRNVRKTLELIEAGPGITMHLADPLVRSQTDHGYRVRSHEEPAESAEAVSIEYCCLCAKLDSFMFGRCNDSTPVLRRCACVPRRVVFAVF